MWLAEKNRRTDYGGYADVGVVSAGGASPTVTADISSGGYELLCPAGIIRLPVSGERHMTLDCADGTRAVIGALADEVPQELENGEIYAATENASVLIKNDGSIVLAGDVSIVGTLTVNGVTIE